MVNQEDSRITAEHWRGLYETLVIAAQASQNSNGRLRAQNQTLAERCERLEAALREAEIHLAAIGTPRDSQGRYNKDGRWEFSEAVPKEVDEREVSAAFTIICAAAREPKP